MTEVAKTSSSSSEVTSSTDPPTFRVDMVETASKFLKNSKVVGSPLNVKKDFLMKKGLSEAEIEAALKLVETTTPEVPPTPPMPPINSVQSFYNVNSLSTKIRDFLNVLLLIGGFSYGAKYLWKKYIVKWLYGKSLVEKSPSEMLTDTSRLILTSIDSMKKSMTALEASIERYSDKLEQHTEEIKRINDAKLKGKDELKAEIQSVKGILLSSSVDVQSPYTSLYGRNISPSRQLFNTQKLFSRSFPVNPTSSLSTTPTIPAWQLENGGSDPDLVTKNPDVTDIKIETNSASAGSSSSEIEMLNDEPNSDENN